MLNVGLWGFGPARHDEFIAKNWELERKLREFRGLKWLYAQTYYKEDEFWELFDRQWYDGLRRKYQAETLPSVWHKVNCQKPAINESWGSWALQFLALGRNLGGSKGNRKWRLSHCKELDMEKRLVMARSEVDELSA